MPAKTFGANTPVRPTNESPNKNANKTSQSPSIDDLLSILAAVTDLVAQSNSLDTQITKASVPALIAPTISAQEPATVQEPSLPRARKSAPRSAVKPAKVTTITQLEKSDTQQSDLEAAIIAYQAALTSGNKRHVSQAYDAICTIYPPLNFVRVWFRKYRYLYDSREDFIQDYLRIFCTCLAAWQPRDTRKESRWGGSGKFANFFWSALNNSFVNMVKSEASGKRNLSSKCPLCASWANPLSSHLLQHHEHLLWEQMASFGMDIDTMIHCPFCKSHRIPRPSACEHHLDGPACDGCKHRAANSALRRHILATHSTYLFERFRALYPHHVTVSSRPASIYTETDEGSGERDLYEQTPSNAAVSTLLAYDLSDVQRLMVEHVFDGALALSYDPEVYNCTKQQYEEELEGLQTIMIICGMGATAEDTYDDQY